MQFTYWYAITAAPENPAAAPPPQWGSGLHDRPLRFVRRSELAAVVSDWPVATINRSSDAVQADEVWRHEAVIEHIMGDVTVLPVRFGTVLAGDDKVAEVLGERYGVLKADLVHVSGCVEMGVRVLWQPPVVEPAAVSATRATTPGASYLLQRAAEEQARRAAQEAGKRLAAEIGKPLRTRAVDVRQSILPTERMLLSASFLVPVEDVGCFRAIVDRLCAEYAGRLAFLCSGPWPPYHFVSA